MIEIDNITIIISGILIVLSATTPFMNAFFRRPKALSISEETSSPTDNIVVNNFEVLDNTDEMSKIGEDETNEPSTFSFPKLSIILTPHENALELEQNVSLFLDQDYPDGFEVIVVVWKGDSETEDVLKRFASNKHLYTTYIPESSRYMSRKKLAITLGVKAARNEWIVLTDIECQPASNQWLKLMARNCKDDKELVIGYTAYDNNTSDYRRFERLHTAMYLMREDVKKIPYRHNGNNLLFRKSMFITGDGFRGNLKYLRGEYDFIVNKYANKSNSALELHRDSWMIEQEPTDKTWRNKHLFYMENRQHMKRSFCHRILFNLDQWALHLNYLFILSALFFSIISQHWLITIIVCLTFIVSISIRTVIGHQAFLLFDEEISLWRIIPYEIGILWHNILYKVKYFKADKYDFISHKI